MNKWKAIAATAIVALIALAAGIVMQRAVQKPAPAAAPAPAKAGSPENVARFLDARFADQGNTPRRLNDWAGKIRVVNFWATWCPPCRDEMPVFVQAQRDWQARGVHIVGISIDQPEAVGRFAKEIGVNYPLLLAEAEGLQWMAQLGNPVGALPFTLVVDGRGRVLQSHAGPVSRELLDNWLKAAAAGS